MKATEGRSMNGTLGIGFILGSLIMSPTDDRGKDNGDRRHKEMILMVCDRAGSGSTAQAMARETTIRIFGRAGIEVRWIDLPPDTCVRPQGSHGFMVVIAPQAPKGWTSPYSMGFAPGGTEGHGRAYVFMNLVKEFIDRFNGESDADRILGLILGHAIAHELGHLLIPGEAHTLDGIMKPRWAYSQWREAVEGSMRFDPRHEAIMRERIDAN
jgi:hypothetical protein